MELAIVLMILLVLIAVGAARLSDGGLTFPYNKKSNLFTATERSFLQLIETAVGQDYRIICRVRLGDILSVRKGVNKKMSRSAQQRAAGKSLDFVLCSKQDMSPVVAIDLVHLSNPKSNGYKTQRDWFVSGALESAGIPHVRIKVKNGYKPADIRECIEAKLAPMRYKEPQEPIVKGTQGAANKPKFINPVAA